jgi:hypothetical protein
MSPASYQKAAASIYEPQKAAEAASLKTARQTSINTLEASKGQVSTDYQSAIENLNQSLNENISKINQLYTERLGGNFSGLQGNDIGGAISTSQRQQATIESTRANKLAQISTDENNANLTYNTDIANLGSKYKSLESEYAQKAYSDAVKQQQDNAYKQAELQLRQESVNISAARAANSGGLTAGEQQAEADKYKVSYKKNANGDKSYVGPNGSTNLYQYASGVNRGDAAGTWQTIKSELKTGSSTDKAAYNKVAKMSQAAGIKYLQQHNAYIFN